MQIHLLCTTVIGYKFYPDFIRSNIMSLDSLSFPLISRNPSKNYKRAWNNPLCSSPIRVFWQTTFDALAALHTVFSIG